MYDSQTALIANYINPIIGDMEVQAVTPRALMVYPDLAENQVSVYQNPKGRYHLCQRQDY